MTELDEFDQTLNSELDKLQREIDGLSKKDYNQKKNAIKKCQASVKSISTLIESYELEISNLDRGQAQKYTDSLKSINQRFQRLKSELEFKKNEGLNQENLFKDRQQAPTDPTQMNAEQMIQLGDQTQAKGLLYKLQQLSKAMNALDGIIQTVNAGNQLADEISAELDKQIAQLDRMYDTVKDTQTTLKRTLLQRHQTYYRQVYTDKLLMCLMGCIFLAIVVLIALSALGYDDGKFNVPDEVKPSTSTTTASTSSRLLRMVI